ncbi:MAG TPA: serine/threonine protein phosphatase [Verrucomicrobiales bacterium]|nr:serine/threonine protein phosphatase [Verrucomicrobiales bacterium]
MNRGRGFRHWLPFCRCRFGDQIQTHSIRRDPRELPAWRTVKHRSFHAPSSPAAHMRIQRIPSLLLPVFISFPLLAAAAGLRAAAPHVTGGKPLPPLPEGAFTLVVIPDTQSYAGKGCKATPDSTDSVTNSNLEAQVQWITANREAQNIVFVTHVGDIVDQNNDEQWSVAKRHLDQLRGVAPFALTVGNHDMTSNGDARLFQRHFPAASFADQPWYLESYRHDRRDQHVSADNVNSAQVFSAGGLDFLHMSLECNAPDDVLAWADAVLRRHPERLAIITTHMDLGIENKPATTEGYIHDPKGRMRWTKIHGERGNSGAWMWGKLYRKHANLRFILCGDQSRVTALRREDRADDGHVIHSLLSDYMSQPVLRLMRFLPAEQRVDVLTYEVGRGFLVESALHVPETGQHQFSLHLPLRPGRAPSS